MEFKTTVTIFTIVVTMVGIIVATSIIGSEDAFAKRGHHRGKWCNPHGCKGDKGWYTKRGHHHCFEGFPGCVESEYHKK